MKFIIVCLFSFVGLNAIQAQIKWDEKRPLTWKDFSGTIDFTSVHYANTTTSTNYQYHVHFHNNFYTLIFKVECVFLPKGSWCKPYKKTDAMLHHEQLHFDIEEIFARKLMAAFKAKTFTANYLVEIKTIYDSIAIEANVAQIKYDKETNYAEIMKDQLKWNELIKEQLQKNGKLVN